MENLLIENKNDFIISDWLSPDEKYCIFLDELYDIKNKKKLGNVWENFDNFKFFVRYSTSVSDLSNTIKESIYESLNKTVITENFNETFTKHKVLLKKLISEGIFSDFFDWAVETGKSSVEGFKDFIKTSYDGISNLVDSISNFEWKEAFDIINKGVIYLAKKLKEALYSPVGMILDAMLVASGIGKSVQWIPWAIVVALDIYELFTGDYEGSIMSHLLETLFDVFGLITTGLVAKSLRVSLKGISKVDDVARVLNKNPKIRNIFQKIPEVLGKISPKLQQAMKYLSQKFPKGANLINSILGKIDAFINKIFEVFGKFFSKKSLAAGAITTGIVYGFDKLFGPGEFNMSDEDMEAFANAQVDFEGALY